MGKARRIIAVILVLAAVSGLIIAAVHLRGYRSRTVLDYGRNVDNSLSLDFSDTTLVGRKEGKRVWEIHADRIRISKDQSKTEFQGIRDGSIFRNDRPLFHLTAGSAIYDSALQNLTVKGGVELHGMNGIALKCGSVDWSGTRNQLICPGKVEITLPNGKMVGKDLEAEGGLKELTLHRIRLTLRLNAGQEESLP